MEEDDLWNHPVTIVQRSLLYGNVQSQLILELALRKIVCPTIEDSEIRQIVMHKRIVDNIITSFREDHKLKTVSDMVFDKLAEYSMDLKTKFDSTRSYHGDEWNKEMEKDILIGLLWDRILDTVHPSISINKNKK